MCTKFPFFEPYFALNLIVSEMSLICRTRVPPSPFVLSHYWHAHCGCIHQMLSYPVYRFGFLSICFSVCSLLNPYSLHLLLRVNTCLMIETLVSHVNNTLQRTIFLMARFIGFDNLSCMFVRHLMHIGVQLFNQSV